MIVNNYERLHIILDLNNWFDYEEFKYICEEKKVPVLDPMSFAQKVGILMCAVQQYPELPAPEAYITFVAKNPIPTLNVYPSKQDAVRPQENPTRPCCGKTTVK
jgi:hypothetical protein